MTSLNGRNLTSLSGRVAIVTGGGTGIGLMIAQGLAANGAKVYITGRRSDVLQRVADAWDKTIGGEIVPMPMDVTRKESIMDAKRIFQQREGKLHILVNNAGQEGPRSLFLSDASAPQRRDAETLGQALFDNESFEGWADLYSINTFSIFFMTTAFLGLLEQGSKDEPNWSSSVINVTSISGLIKVAQDHFAYNSAKAAASHLTKLLSTEITLKGFSVRVNAIAPGVYASEMTLDIIKPEDTDIVAKGLLPVPARRAGSVEEMAGTAVYLASKAGGYVNGQEIAIDGGFMAVNPSVL
ncbi:hypothetical protein AMATHDRAFT_136133 [Amanita thiersii Skay4041]|uniref:Uncharacterized protein n=1 Tax=Amanita thiersii Skay4041 TaxID=703135 RepID=A0A2A9P0A4_9AGAR|nr:hypothetical protein AMATHDRAFT_136133 [Amanita thiersii Skay4041]